MRILINDTEVDIPSSLTEITLKQRIDYQIEQGNILEEMSKSIREIEDPDERELEAVQFQFEKMVRTVAFFTGCTPEAIKESEFVNTVASIYFSGLDTIMKEEAEIELTQQDFFEWNGEEWFLAPPLLKNGDKMTFGEMIDSKQIIQNMVKLGKNRWECLVPLCAIFLRRKEEVYLESYLYEDSERLKLMETLPLDIALQVGFFLTRSLSTYMKIFQSSLSPELKEEESTPKSISKTLVG